MGLCGHGAGELIDFAKWHTRCSGSFSSMPLFHALIRRWHSQRSRRVRAERELIAVMGEPLLAARPLAPEAVRALALQLLEHWFDGRRSLLPVVSARSQDGRTSLAMQLARAFAALGQRTLLIDADLRAPSLHKKFSIANQGGLADFLDSRDVRLAACEENLAVLTAGNVREDPLELLSRERLRRFVAAAARPFRIVLADTPAAARGPDLEMLAALAGGALVVV